VCSECRLCARQKKGLSQCRCRKVTEGAAGSSQIPASAPQNPAQSAITDQELEVLNGVVKNLYPLNNQQLLDVAVEAIQRANQQLGQTQKSRNYLFVTRVTAVSNSYAGHIQRRMRQTSGGPRETPHSSHSPDPQLNFNGGGTLVQPIAPVTPSPPPATSPNSGNPQNKRSFQDFNVDPSLSGYHHSPLTWR